MCRAQTRDSIRNELREKVAGRNYGKYLVRVTLRRVRGFSDKTISFDFPVTALVGPNGGGKTTILAAATTPYKAVMPRRFFPKNGYFDRSMAGWAIEAECIDKSLDKEGTIRRSARFGIERWRRYPLPRDVLVFGVDRTIPPHERVGLAWERQSTFSARDEDVFDLDGVVAEYSQAVLDMPIQGYKIIGGTDVYGGRFVTLLGGQTCSGDTYSEFHFGAGQSSVIRMIHGIEQLSENSLVLIEEIENGLHPLATVRMVDYLIDFAHRKKSQVVFTTHSNDALEPLPPEAIWVAIDNNVLQGKPDIRALKAIQGYAESLGVIFVEDDFSRAWVGGILRYSGDESLKALDVYAMKGDSLAVQANKHHNADPSVRQRSTCLLDGDSQQQEDSASGVFRLPGACPEKYVFDSVMNKAGDNVEWLCFALQQNAEEADQVIAVCNRVGRTNTDHHLLFDQIGRELGGLSRESTQDAFIGLWCKLHPGDIGAILSQVQTALGAERVPA